MITERLQRYDNGEITAMKERDELTGRIIACCYEVHTKLGPGFVERIYLNALKISLEEQKINFESEKELAVLFKDKNVGKFRIDLLIEGKVIVELKSVIGNPPKLFEAQVVSYLKASGLKVGLLVNFGGRKCQIRRLML